MFICKLLVKSLITTYKPYIEGALLERGTTFVNPTNVPVKMKHEIINRHGHQLHISEISFYRVIISAKMRQFLPQRLNQCGVVRIAVNQLHTAHCISSE